MNLYEVLFESIKEGLILVDRKGEIVDLNKTGAGMFGYEKSELIGHKIEKLVPMKARDKHESYRDEYKENPTTRPMGSSLKLDGLRKDNSEFPVQISLNPFKTNNAAPAGGQGNSYVIALVSDVTERRENEEMLQKLRESLEQKVIERTKELRESEQLYKSIARNFPSGVISIFDRSYKYLFAEGQGLYELGIKTEDLIGLDYLERIDESARDKVKEELDKVFNGTTINFEIDIGNRVYMINAVPLSDEEGIVDRILLVEKNITAQKEVAKKLEATLIKERELAEMKSRFVSMASHEFRTPLSTVNSSASLIKKYHERKEYDRLDKHVERIKNAVRNLTGILNDFLSFEKLEAGKVNASVQPYDIPVLLKEACDEMDSIMKPNQQLIYKGPSQLTLETDGQLFKNAILNLLSNAVKYSHDDGKVIVKLENHEKEIIVSIQDFGIGIPMKDQSNLFSRFFRAKNVTNIEGTGLGLNIVLRYLSLLKGEISFQSKEGEGTLFFITLSK